MQAWAGSAVDWRDRWPQVGFWAAAGAATCRADMWRCGVFASDSCPLCLHTAGLRWTRWRAHIEPGEHRRDSRVGLRSGAVFYRQSDQKFWARWLCWQAGL